MYLTSTGGSSPFGLGQPASKRYRPPYDKGGIPIGEGDAQNILTILAGPSPYQAYIAHNMATKGAAPPKKFLRIVTNVGTQVPKPLQHLFTSGGVGPTHDDVTMEGVAQGLNRKVIRHPAIEGRIREVYKDKINDARLKLSEVPEGTELIVDGRLGFPTIKCENVYILPGIPEILEQKFHAIRERFDLKRLIATLTMQGRMSRWIVSALPIGIIIILQLENPHYLHPLLASTGGKIVFALTAAWAVAGSYAIKKIVEIEV